MAHDPGPCGPQFEDWEAAYRDWQNKDSAADAAARNAAYASTTALAVCGGAWWSGIGTAACVIAVAAALAADAESVAASLARNDAAGASESARSAYENCVEEHNWYYRP